MLGKLPQLFSSDRNPSKPKSGKCRQLSRDDSLPSDRRGNLPLERVFKEDLLVNKSHSFKEIMLPN